MTVQSPGSPSVAFVTLGCAKNEVDSDKMRARVLAAGFAVADEPAQADAVVVNTCSFITEATEEAIATILELLGLPRLADGTAKLVVAGCMPARYGSELARELPEVAAFVSCAEEDGIAGVLGRVLGMDADDCPGAAAAGDQPAADAATAGVVAEHSPAAAGRAAANATPAAHPDAPPPTRTVSAPWAYVKIADGCDRRCSFCTIPRIRGHYRSVPASEIVAEVAELVANGVREVVLIAQDTGIWGRDLRPRRGQAGDGSSIPRIDAGEGSREAQGRQTEEPSPACPPSGEPVDLAGLLELLATQFPTTWLRVMYLQPQGITDALLATMARHANICDYLDIPLQHASARVLADMNRRGSAEDYLALLARIRAVLPEVTLRTTVIAGFPGETRAEARELERFIAQAGFDYVGVFPYSQEDGTAAGERPDQVPPRTRRARAQRLRDVADAIGFERVAAQVGRVEEVLVTDYDEDVLAAPPGTPPGTGDAVGATGAGGDMGGPGDAAGTPGTGAGGAPGTDAGAGGVRTAPPPQNYPLLGRTKRQAPEVDGMVHLDCGTRGELVSATMVEAYCYELDGRVAAGDV